MSNNKKALYPTEPLKVWDEAKKLRARIFKDYVEAHDKGKLRVFSSTSISPSLASGFEDVQIMGLEPLLAQLGATQEFAMRCLQASETYGFSRDMCAMSKLLWGSAIWDKFNLPDGTVLDKWPNPDLMICTGLSGCHNKIIQFLAEYKERPFYLIDSPRFYPYNDDDTIDFLTMQVMDLIEWMEKVTKRKFNDELFIQGVYNQFRAFRLWTKIMILNQTIPAPLDEKSILALITPSVTRPHTQEVVDFYTHVLEETEDRVARGIAAAPNEQFRVISDAIPPWSYLSIWRYLEREYGAVYVASPYSVLIIGSWMLDDKGNLVPVPTPEEQKWKITNREQAVRALMWYKSFFATETSYTIASVEAHHECMKAIAKNWKANAAILHLNRGCPMMGLGGVESRNALQEAGFPAMIIEGSSADPRDLNLVRTKEEIDIFLDFVGVKRASPAKV